MPTLYINDGNATYAYATIGTSTAKKYTGSVSVAEGENVNCVVMGIDRSTYGEAYIDITDVVGTKSGLDLYVRPTGATSSTSAKFTFKMPPFDILLSVYKDTEYSMLILPYNLVLDVDSCFNAMIDGTNKLAVYDKVCVGGTVYSYNDYSPVIDGTSFVSFAGAKVVYYKYTVVDEGPGSLVETVYAKSGSYPMYGILDGYFYEIAFR